MHVATQFKGDKIVFMLNWLLNSPDPQTGWEIPLPVGYAGMTESVRRLLVVEHLSSEEAPVKEPYGNPFNPWEFFFQELINRHEWSEEKLRNLTILLATS